MAGHDVVALWQRAAFNHRQRLLTLLHIAVNTSTPELLGQAETILCQTFLHIRMNRCMRHGWISAVRFNKLAHGMHQ